jgi:hypothetical protein
MRFKLTRFRRPALFLIAAGWLGALPGSAAGQEADGSVDRITAAFSDPSKPGTLEVHLLNGGITVTGYDGKDVLIESTGSSRSISRDSDPSKARGMRRLTPGPGGLEVEEKDNHMKIAAGGIGGTVRMNLRVPFRTSLKLETINFGDIRVDAVEGDLEIQNVNGGIALNDVSGSVTANSVNKDLKIVFDRVNPEKPMSFSSVNGDVDVTFPAAVKANVKLKSEMGDIYTDFEMQVNEKSEKSEENDRPRGGRYKVKIDRSFFGRINGGGPEYQFYTFNGDIYIRKK